MTSSIASNSTTAFANQQQPADEMKAKVAADARALPSRAEVEAESEKKLAEFEKRRAEFDRQAKLGELSSLDGRRDSAKRMLKLAHDRREKLQKIVATPPKEAEVLEGAEAKRMLQVAEERAAKYGSPVGFGFFEGDYLYRMKPGGKITRQNKDVPTPHEHMEYTQLLKEDDERYPKFVMEKNDEIAGFEQRKAELLSDLGLTEDEWREQVKVSGNISIEV